MSTVAFYINTVKVLFYILTQYQIACQLILKFPEDLINYIS